MTEQIQVVGLTTTDVLNGVQYTLLTKTGDTHYDYVFMPMGGNKYALRITPTVDKTIESKPLTNATLVWSGEWLTLQCSISHALYNSKTKVFSNPAPLFENEEDLLPKRWAMIIKNYPEAIVGFLAAGKSVVYADEWDRLPSIIPEDVIVLNVHDFPISEIVMRLPQRTRAVILDPQVQE